MRQWLWRNAAAARAGISGFRSRGLSSCALFGVESSAPCVRDFLARRQDAKHSLIFVRHKKLRLGPTTNKVLALENVASWKQNEVPNERTKAPYDVLPRRTKMQRARDLVDAVLPLPDVKEEIWAACDTWIAWELRFPLHTIKMATHRLFRLKQWRRVIHVIKWMFSKGHGFTMNTYGCLLRALDIDGRVDEVEHIWHTFVVTKQESVPRVMYARMITMYDRRALPDKAIKMFKELELSGTRPDPATIIRIGKIYEKLGFTNKTAELLEKHKPTKRFISFKFRTKSHKFMGVPGHDRRRLTSSEKQKKRKLRERLATIIDFS
ncbi:pentatricopeptide repeat-containing protein At4g18975, chloroplastic [Selaginella moellendorffii]|uniref:pentatricopeptide repeat-containing protein At4g18975, chloroplastic n=2 Tax=Selaginella moellendorffii TaxID=88036 RepID=UPI000D1C71FB|nr:pentatricopeptide repeat-containing protein At4g18975, chloroplastic [Selaginella moellendorffii]|eukprot:XP_024537682.1 pentatricopeptide repeat-containing protein At4g18975, chloroplastic [Selaginella moellendorffii]